MTAPTRPHTVTELVTQLVDHYDDGRSTRPLLDRVRELVEPGATGPTDELKQQQRKAPASPSPVTDHALNIVDDVERAGRDYEAAARHALGFGRHPRGSSTRNSLDALRALPALLDALPADHELTELARDRLATLHARAATLTGHRQPWLRLPFPCPECDHRTLRQRPADHAVVCLAPDCRDEDGNRREWDEHAFRLLGRIVDSLEAAP